jgi:hypothetical protein
MYSYSRSLVQLRYIKDQLTVCKLCIQCMKCLICFRISFHRLEKKMGHTLSVEYLCVSIIKIVLTLLFVFSEKFLQFSTYFLSSSYIECRVCIQSIDLKHIKQLFSVYLYVILIYQPVSVKRRVETFPYSNQDLKQIYPPVTVNRSVKTFQYCKIQSPRPISVPPDYYMVDRF